MTDDPIQRVPAMHLGLCENCLTIHAVWPHPDRIGPVPEPDDWEAFATNCNVCDDGHINWDEVNFPATDYLKRGY